MVDQCYKKKVLGTSGIYSTHHHSFQV